MPESSRLLTESEYRYIINNLGSGGSSSPVSAEAIIVTIPTTGWSDTFPYTITLPADGAVDSNSPIFYLYTTGETATDEELAGVKLIVDMSTTTNYVHITASKVPTSSFKIALYGLASGTEVEGDLSEKYNILSGKVNDLETLVSGLEEVDNELNDAISEVAELANEASTIAKGRNRARVFATTEDMNAWLSDSTNAGQAIVGDNLYIVELEVPDWWISEVLTEVDSETGFYYKIAQLETQKVDLTTIESDISDLKDKDAEIEAAIEDAQTLTHVSGTMAVVEDSAEDSLLNLKLFGKTEQVTTTGAQLVDIDTALTNWGASYTISGNTYTVTDIENGYKSPVSFNGADIEVTLSCTVTNTSATRPRIELVNSSGECVGLLDENVTSVTATASKIRLNYGTAGTFTFTKPMLNAGSTALPWEPYTGGMPAPNPIYPQELVSVSGDGEIGVGVVGKNLLQNTATTQTINGVTFTVNTDGSVVVKGTATKNTNFYIHEPFELPDGDFILSGSKMGDYSTCCLAYSNYDDFSYFNFDGDTHISKFDHEKYPRSSVLIFVYGGATVDTVMYPMVRLASIENDTYEPYRSAVLPVSTPGGLPGIPVTNRTLANYTDADGKMWCCDEVDLERGKYVKRVTLKNITGVTGVDSSGLLFRVKGDDTLLRGSGLISESYTYLPIEDARLYNYAIAMSGVNIYIRNKDYTTYDEFNTHLAAAPITVMVALATPIETDLAADQIKAYRAILTKNPTTTIFTDAGAYFEADVVRESETSRHIGAKIARLESVMSDILNRLGGLKFTSVSSLPGTTDPNTIYFTDN